MPLPYSRTGRNACPLSQWLIHCPGLAHAEWAVKSDFKFHHALRVRFGETDMQGIVFNAHHLTYFDVAWTEYFRALGLEYKDLVALGADTVLARITVEFKSSAKFDDLIEIHTRISRIGNTSLTFDFEIYPQGEDRLIASASSVYVCVDPKTRNRCGYRTSCEKGLGSSRRKIRDRSEGGARRAPLHQPAATCTAAMFSMMAPANSEVRTFVAPSIKRSRS